MNYIERRERQLKVAKERHDRAAVAIMEADRRWSPDPETPMLVVVAGIRWGKAA